MAGSENNKNVLTIAFGNAVNDNCGSDRKSAGFQTFKSKTFLRNTVKAFQRSLTPIADFVKKSRPYAWFKGLEKNKFFPKFMAFKGGFSSVYLGIMLAPAVVGYGTILGGTAIAVCATALIGTGLIGAFNYGRHIFQDGIELIRTRMLKKPARPRPERTAGGLNKSPTDRSPWGLIRKSKLARKAGQSGLAQIISRAPMYHKLKNMKIWKDMDKIGKDQDVVMRMFATGGALTTVAISAIILMQSAVPLTAALSFTGAGLFAAYIGGNLIGGLVAFGTHGFHLFDSSKKALRPAEHYSHSKVAARFDYRCSTLQVGYAKSVFQQQANTPAAKNDNPHDPGKGPSEQRPSSPRRP